MISACPFIRSTNSACADVQHLSPSPTKREQFSSKREGRAPAVSIEGKSR